MTFLFWIVYKYDYVIDRLEMDVTVLYVSKYESLLSVHGFIQTPHIHDRYNNVVNTTHKWPIQQCREHLTYKTDTTMSWTPHIQDRYNNVVNTSHTGQVQQWREHHTYKTDTTMSFRSYMDCSVHTMSAYIRIQSINHE